MSTTIQGRDHVFTLTPVGDQTRVACKARTGNTELVFHLDVCPDSCAFTNEQGLAYSCGDKVWIGNTQHTLNGDKINLAWFGEHLYATTEKETTRVISLFFVSESRKTKITDMQIEEKYRFDDEGLVVGDRLLPLVDNQQFHIYGIPEPGRLVYVTDYPDRRVYLFYKDLEFIMYEFGNNPDFPTQVVAPTFRIRLRESKSKNSMDLVDKNIIVLI